MQKLIKLLRDPVWKVVGIVAGIIFAFATFTKTDAGTRTVAVIHSKQERLVNQWLPGDRFKLQVAGSSYDIDRAVVDRYQIINLSKKSIKGGDFLDPLRVDSPSKSVRVVSVESCSPQLAQACTPSGQHANSFVRTAWKQVDSSWVAESPHLNPGDTACILVVTEHEKLGQGSDAAPAPKLNVRVDDYSVVAFKSIYEYELNRSKEITEHFNVSILLLGGGVYWFLMLFAVLLFAGLWLANRGRWADTLSAGGVARCTFVALMAASTAEILVDIFVNRRGNLADPALHPVIWPLLIVQLGFLAYLIWRALHAPEPLRS